MKPHKYSNKTPILVKVMRSLFFIACLLCLALVAGITNARKDQGEYWKDVSKKNGDGDNTSVESSNLKVELSVAEEIEPTHVPIVDGLKPDDNIKSIDEKSFVRDFEPRPNFFHYKHGANGNIKSIDEKSFVRDFEPRPNIFLYGTHGANGNIKSIDEKSFVRDFEPRPNIFLYGTYGANGNIKSIDEKSFVRDFEPRPNFFHYKHGANGNIKSIDEKSFVRRPSVEADVDNQKLGTNDVNVYVE